MKTINTSVFVRFDFDHNKVFQFGDVKLVRPDHWTENGEEKAEGNVNHLETNPQVADVLADCENYEVKKGDKVFLHYMAFEWAEEMEFGGQKGHIIQGDYILMKIAGEDFEMIGDTYIGQQQFSKETVLDWGLIMNVEKRPIASKIELTHLPKEPKAERQELKAGDTVITVDDNQYIFDYGGRQYVKLTGDEIVGVI